ncbi:MAG: hypothetical protein V4594_21840 [Bacteroidota bacterium]
MNQDIKLELLKSAGKSLLSLPVLTFLAEAIEVQGKVKQQRAIEFLTDLAEYLQIKHLLEVNHKRLNSEEFRDLLDQAIQKVSTTSSEQKKKLFKHVLAAHLVLETQPKITEIYLKIIGRITEKQILILDGLEQSFGDDYVRLHEQIYSLQTEIKTMQAEQFRELEYVSDNSQVEARDKMIEDKRKQIQEFRDKASVNKWHQFENYDCERSEFYFLIQDLFNNGLITDEGPRIGTDPFTVVQINQMGMDILTFLKDDV